MSRQRGIPAPSDFDPEARSIWLDAQRALRAQGTWQDTDAPLLEAYVRCVVLARKARQAAASDPFVTGSRGQPAAHPGLKVADSSERAALSYANALLLTADARKRHDLAPASDPSDAFFLAGGLVEAG
jgi:P27 family predicted phage terminase small subunit